MEHDSKHPPTALILCGGGITGWLWEVGALAALDDYLVGGRGVLGFGTVVGTSAGALAGALVAGGVRPGAIYKSVIKHQETYISLRRSDFYGFNWGNLGRLAENMLVHTATGVWALVRHPLRFSFTDLAFSILESLPPGMFSTDNLERFIDRVFKRNRVPRAFAEMPLPFYATATDLDSGERVVFGPDSNADIPLPRALAASASVPVFFRPIRINDRDLVDGGIGRVGHLDLATKRGARLLVVLNPMVPIHNDRETVQLKDPMGFRRRLRIRDKGPVYIADQVYKANCATMLRSELAAEKAAHPGLDAVVLEPGRDNVPMWETNLMSLDSRVELMEAGYHDAAQALRARHAELAPAFARHGMRCDLGGLDEGKIAREAERRARA